ncbi:MAG: hypothetical protein BGN98_03720 [Microbacterium sp. 69-7]|uniref:phosphatase PAP2 family protein n=1 Tax=Microbacterium sp. 69-7 TaxID=1895784 RepID=UPI00096637E6|nr:phosphatase PAP2 family protein [Microbacterium sp. 69-7]OJU47807.1 MAG: hypothetical protein BGN98_03720 [Microbacterium sp. 69-7]
MAQNSEHAINTATRRWPGLPWEFSLTVAVCLAGMIGVLLWGLVVSRDKNELGFDIWLNGAQAPFMDAWGEFAAFAVGAPMAIAIGVAFAGLAGWRYRSLAVGLGAGLAVALSWLSSALIKALVARPRPDWSAITHHVGPIEVDASFPSGHVTFISALSTVVVLLLWTSRYRWGAVALGGTATLIIAIGRVYVGAHYPSDVIAAVVYGFFAATLAYAVIGRLLSVGDIQQRIDRLFPAPFRSERSAS